MPDEAPVLQVPTHTEKVVEYIRDQILAGDYKPGQRVTESQLSKSLRISRSPVREAVQQLAQEGLLERTSYRGAKVASFDMATVVELFELREAIEGMAARLAATRAPPEQLKNLQGLLEGVERQLASEEQPRYPVGSDFHSQIIAMAGNRRLQERALEIHAQIRLARSISGSAPNRALDALSEHQAIFEAVRTRRADKAEELMRKHIQSSLAHTRSILSNPEATQ